MTASAGNQTFLTVLAVAALSGPGLWAFLQWAFDFRKRRRAEKKELDDAEVRKDEKRREDEALLSKLQVAAQKSALESARSETRRVRRDYRAMRNGFLELREATILLLEGYERLMSRAQPDSDKGSESYSFRIDLSEFGESRRIVNEARRHLLPGLSPPPLEDEDNEDDDED